MWMYLGGEELPSLMTLAAITAAAVIASILIGYLVVNRQVVSRLTTLAQQMTSLADGNKDITVDTKGSDEIAGMATTVEVFRVNALEVDRMRAEQDEAERRSSAERHQQRLELASDFESRVKSIIDRVGQSAREMEATAKTMSDGANSVQERSVDGVSAAQQTSNNVQTVAAAAEELSASIREISDKISQSSEQARRANDQAAETTAGRGSGRRGSPDRHRGHLDQRHRRADQSPRPQRHHRSGTRRAMQAKASRLSPPEVKNLAAQMAKATEEITAQIKTVQDGVVEAVTAIRGVAGAIVEIDANVTAIAGAVEEQGASTQEIARSSQDAAAGTSEMTQTIEGVSSVANDTGGQAKAVLSAAGTLSTEAGTLDREVSAFLSQLRGGGKT